MRIAFITFEYPPYVQGGAGVYAYNITKELAKLGIEVHVICPQVKESNGYDIEHGISVHQLSFMNKPGFAVASFWINLRKNFKKIEKESRGFDVIHENVISAFSLSKKIAKTPRILTVHHLSRDEIAILKPPISERIKTAGGETGILTPYFEKVSIERADKIIAVSNYTKRKIIEYYNIPGEKIEAIYNGLEAKNYNFKENELNVVKRRFGIYDKPTVLFVGRINDKRKNIDLLLKSFKLILEKVDAILIITGSGDKKLCSKLLNPIKENVIFTGYVTNETLRKLYGISDVYVSSSKLEGFGLTILDAMAAGKPVVAINVGAVPEIVENKRNGLLVSDNIDEFSTAILTYLEDKKKALATGKINIEHAKQFSWRKSAERLVEIYDAVD